MEQGRSGDVNATTADLSKYCDVSDDDTLLLAAIKDDFERAPTPTGQRRRR